MELEQFRDLYPFSVTFFGWDRSEGWGCQVSYNRVGLVEFIHNHGLGHLDLTNHVHIFDSISTRLVEYLEIYNDFPWKSFPGY